MRINSKQLLLIISPFAFLLCAQALAAEPTTSKTAPDRVPYEGIQTRLIKPAGLRFFQDTNVTVLEHLGDKTDIPVQAPPLSVVRKRLNAFDKQRKMKDFFLYRYEMANEIRKLPDGRKAFSYYKHQDGHKLDYLLIKPERVEPGQKYPLVLNLHGAGGWKDNMANIAGMPGHSLLSRASKFPCFLLVPQADQREFWAYGASNRKARNKPSWRKDDKSLGDNVVGMVKQVSQSLPIDPSRIYVVGTSMGGLGTMGMVTEHPGIFAGAIAIVPTPLPEDAPKLDCPLWLITAEFEGVDAKPGSNMDLPQKVAYNFAFYEQARKLNKPVRLTMLAGHGHHITHLAFEYPGVWTWLFEQKRSN